jgi:flavin reductase (DIM6/NTAB) family NADH-FMN oxidoreductase RutF
VRDLDRFHREMAALDGPMIVVTAAAGARRAGCLVGFHTQVSIDPARYLVCLSVNNHTYRIAAGTTHLGVHFLGADQRAMAARFGTRCSDEVDKFHGLEVEVGPGGAPVLRDVAHWFVAEIDGTLPVGDHVAFGLVPVASGGAPDRRPLLGFQAVKDLDAAHAP